MLAVAMLAACSRGEVREPAPWRWIDSPPIEAVSASDLQQVDCVESYDFSAGALPPGLALVEGAHLERPGAGVTIRGGWVAPRIELLRRFRVEEAELVRLVVSGLRVGSVKVRWKGDAADAAGSGEIALNRGAGTGALRDHFVVDLSGSRRPASFRIELEPTSAAGEIVTLSELCVGRRGDPGMRLEKLAQLPWKVTLAGDTRDALLVPSSGTLARTGQLPERPRFEFGVGRLLGPPVPTKVVVEQTSGGGTPVRLLERRLSADELAAGWVDLAADPKPARSATLSVRVTPEGPAAGFAVAVSAPRVRSLGRVPDLPNIVLVSIDTLRADHLSLYGYERSTSPRLDAWARGHAAVFRRVVAPSSWTLPSHFSLFTGVEGFKHPANHSSISIDATAYQFLAEQLWRAGYLTQAFTGGAYVSPDYGLARGFESFRWWEHKDLRERELATDVEQAQRFLSSAPAEPFFLFFHTYEVHTPNYPREPWFSRFHGRPDDRIVDLGPPSPTRPEEGFLGTGHWLLRRVTSPETAPLGPQDGDLPRDAYDSNIAYADETLAPLLERLVRAPWAERTVIAVVSDHGESLGENGRVGHNFLSLDNLLVPLLLVVPDGSGRGEVIASQVRLHDLYATLLEYAKVPLPEGVDSRSLVPLLHGVQERGRLAFSYVSLTNYGMSLLTPGGLKVEWRNSPWRALAGRFLWSRVEDFTERPIEVADAGPEAARWQGAIQDAYGNGAPGLRVELDSSGGEKADVEIVTELVDPVSVKTTSAAAAPFDWVDVGRLRAELAPGRPILLNFERFPRRQIALTVTARWSGCTEPARAEVVATAAELRSPAERTLAPAGCAPGVDRQPIRWRTTWKGPVPSSHWLPANRQLEEDLRALGYLQ